MSSQKIRNKSSPTAGYVVVVVIIISLLRHDRYKNGTLDTIQLNRQKLNIQSYPKPKKQFQFVCLNNKNILLEYRSNSYSHGK